MLFGMILIGVGNALIVKRNVVTNFMDGVIELSTDKSSYEKGEMVAIITTNVGNTEIGIIGPHFYIFNEQGEIIIDAWLECIWVLKPGESKTWFWNQRDMNGKQVPKGSYTVEGYFPVNNETTYVDNTSFNITAKVEALDISFGFMKIIAIIKNNEPIEAETRVTLALPSPHYHQG
ncbi:MAG TPA: hypothetical protein ENG24_01075 [Thermoplasmatales archaeon]|nr:hypothetical protein [Thermoplasmatales archaeon]